MSDRLISDQLTAPCRRVAVYELTTPDLSFEEDVELYADIGVAGIGLCEVKLPSPLRDADLKARIADSGLVVTACLPSVDSVLTQPLVTGPRLPADRVTALCESIRRLSKFDPSAVICTTGPKGSWSTTEARRLVVDGLRQAASAAEEVGVRLALEPLNEFIALDWSIVTNLVEALDLLDEIDRPSLGILADSWHLWNTPMVKQMIDRNIDKIFAVHISDWREPPHSWCDRVLPGQGVIDFSEFIGTLEIAGYRGMYDLEIFSDDGRHGTALPDSLWKLPPRELVTRAYRAFCDVAGP